MVESVLEAKLPDLVVAEPIDDLLVVRVCVRSVQSCVACGELPACCHRLIQSENSAMTQDFKG